MFQPHCKHRNRICRRISEIIGKNDFLSTETELKQRKSHQSNNSNSSEKNMEKKQENEATAKDYFEQAIEIDSIPEEQNLLIVIPGTLSVFSPINDIILAIFSPCSASGVAFPTIRSSIISSFNSGVFLIKCFITWADSSSGLINLNIPL
mgnify:CR=1 FL=1